MDFVRRVFSIRIHSPLLSGLITAFVWMFVGALVLSLFLWLTGMREQDLSSYTYFVHSIALLFGGFASGKKSGERGWYHGGITGVVYGLLVFVIGFLALNSSIQLYDLLQWVIAFFVAALGGIFGVNIKR
ncbi:MULTISPECIES: TIGR04086 family membrane protein [unclassified Paenibacillus]|uniref:TIGR04086 family membrane protein n=1 Tax=Paenibacillus provencensis TaxID=441151 RepID=A0ABW3Q9F8_9BACL|nr:MULTISPECIES: TIGR04086 family membrane protein [unclassified Paenibacillus]MCM3129963.1 TIGR04086 family membrane protein [Paenibacillus sp. MER 78]SFS62286.1 putative membrane protein, TIGR04086 family [Paenibacillus sp. 453mf]